MGTLKKNPKKQKLLSDKAIYFFVFTAHILEEFIHPYICLSHSLSFVVSLTCLLLFHNSTFSHFFCVIYIPFFLIPRISFFSTFLLRDIFFFVMTPLSTPLTGKRWKDNLVYILLVSNNLSDKMTYHSVTFFVIVPKLTMHLNMSLFFLQEVSLELKFGLMLIISYE